MSPARNDSPMAVRQFDLTYSPQEGDKSALTIIYTLRPEWEHSEGPVKLVRFTDGITNTLLKAEKRRPGLSQEEVDDDAVLLRAYGAGTDILIDREREVRAHSLLATKNLAPPLFARFNNGLLYKYIPGTVCTPQDLSKPAIYRGVAQKLGQWHGALSIDIMSDKGALVPVPKTANGANGEINSHLNGEGESADIPFPSLWSVMKSWISALPAESDKQRERKEELRAELAVMKARLIPTPGLLGRHYVFSHCDLLSGNVIVQQSTAMNGAGNGIPPTDINFIDYEYATPTPAAFDIANHFAEWIGFECDFSAVPTKSQRRDFLEHYVPSFLKHADSDKKSTVSLPDAVNQLYEQVDEWRGIPGFYWGIWSLIQAQISHIDFDYASYAETRFGEYYNWKAETDGSRKRDGKELSLREKVWHSE